MADNKIVVTEQEVATITEEAMDLKVVDNISYERAGLILKAYKLMAKNIKEYHKPMKVAADIAKKAILDKEKAQLAGLEPGTEYLTHEMTVWFQEQEKIRKEAERKLQEKVKKDEEDERLRLAKIAEEEGNDEEADAILSEESHVPPPQVHSSTPKVAGMAMRTTWKAKITNIRELIKAVHEGKVPVNALKADDVFLNQQARSLKGTIEYPGVKFYTDSKMGGVRQ